MKYYLIAGEASGDLHGSNLIKALKQVDDNASFRCLGGDRMQSAGAELAKHYRDTAFMGFWEVISNLGAILKSLKECKADILAWRPDVVILIDYPGFNLRIAKWLKKNRITVFYYISPQIWAWNAGRAHQIKRVVDRMFVILPFEQDFYKRYGYEVDFVGHPLLDAIATRTMEDDLREKNGLSRKPVIALLPGSRKQEVKIMLPEMLKIIPSFNDYQFVVAASDNIEPAFYEKFTAGKDVKTLFNNTYNILENAHTAVVTSGTATLETALFNVPQVVCYKGSPFSYFIGSRLVKIKYISLVNLILGEEAVKELIQGECTAHNIEREVQYILQPGRRNKIFDKYARLKQMLGETGASQKTASLMYKYLTSNVELPHSS